MSEDAEPPMPTTRSPQARMAPRRVHYLVPDEAHRMARPLAVEPWTTEEAESALQRWILGTNEAWIAVMNRYNRVFRLLDGVLRAFGQVVFVNNSVSSVVILVALLIGSPVQCGLGVLSAAIGTLSAWALGADQESAFVGLFGFNGVLVGAGAGLIEADLGVQVVWAVCGSVMSVPVQLALSNVLIVFKVVSLTLPFNLVSLMLMAALNIGFGPAPRATVEVGTAVWQGTLVGVSNIFLQASWPVGLAIVGGVCISSRILAAGLVVGSFVATAVALAIDAPRDLVALGLLSLNGALVTTAAVYFFVLSVKVALIGVLGSGASALVTKAFLERFNLPFLTLPFCVVTLVLLLLRDVTSHLVPVRLADLSTPEAHLKAHRKAASTVFLAEMQSSRPNTQNANVTE